VVWQNDQVAIEPTRLLFNVDEYEALGTIGFFGDDRRLELIDGEILEMTPIGHVHANCVRRLNALFTSRLADRAVIDVQGPVRLGSLSEPQPDLILLEPPLSRYDHRHAMAADVLLIVEVSDTTLRFDRRVKAPLYARQGLGELWIVDINAGMVEVHRQPSPEGYRMVERLGRDDMITPLALPDFRVGVDEIFG
jgi:Uma2 family endonuclease